MADLKWLAASCVAITISGCQTAGVSEADDNLARSSVMSPGQEAYELRCRGCHEPAAPGAPDRAKLAEMNPDFIVKALKNGAMSIYALNLEDETARQIAVFLTSETDVSS